MKINLFGKLACAALCVFLLTGCAGNAKIGVSSFQASTLPGKQLAEGGMADVGETAGSFTLSTKGVDVSYHLNANKTVEQLGQLAEDTVKAGGDLIAYTVSFATGLFTP